jgi:hypothetical protein
VLRLIADENVNQAIVDGLRQVIPVIDIVLAKEVGLLRTDDRLILEWAATNDRILVTHDVRTMPRYAYERVAAGLPLPGVIVLPSHLSVGRAVDGLVLLTTCSGHDELQDRVVFLPL